MPSPAERIYDAAVAELAGQQARANQITNSMGPLGAAAGAAALLLKPALGDISHRQFPRLLFAGLGILGLLVVLGAGIAVLVGVEVAGADPAELSEVARKPGLVDNAQAFDLEAALGLIDTRKLNDKAVARLQALLTIAAVGFLIELAGLAVAAVIATQPKAKPVTRASAALRITTAHVSKVGIIVAGELRPSARGAVRVVVLVHGRRSERMSLTARLRDARFSAHARARPADWPLRSARFSVIGPGSRTVAPAMLTRVASAQ